jgi:hypothetical protein
LNLYTDELERTSVRRDHGLIGVLPRNLNEGTEENTEVKVATVPDEIRTERLPNTSPTRGAIIFLDSVRICTKHDGCHV